jgi:pimeloyl-ACP methyl ester carboxylesterase
MADVTQIEIGSLVFDARVAGPPEGEAVILLHGFPQTSLEWSAQLEALAAAGYRAIAPDQRGYSPGARPRELSEYVRPKLAGDVLGMADALGIERFHVVGHDWGAIVAWDVAVMAPARVRTANIVSVPHPDAFREQLADHGSAQYQASAYFDMFCAPNAAEGWLASAGSFPRELYAGVPDAHVDAYVERFSDVGALRAGLSWYAANIEARQIKGEPIGPVEVPTLFIWSDGDTALMREGAEKTAEHVRAPYRFEVIEGVNHWVFEIAAERVNALLLDHLGS